MFAGIGGICLGFKQAGFDIVWANEKDAAACRTYRYNFGDNYLIEANIKKVKKNTIPQFDVLTAGFPCQPFSVAVEEIPAHDVLCAGFPCQAFSKAGFQKGMSDTRGTLFFEIERILQYHKTKYIILENVRNLVSHDQGNTWKTIHSHLKALGYRLTKAPIIVSPHQFGVPQLRERVVILGIYDPENSDENLEITFENLKEKDQNSIYSILDEGKVEDKYYISEKEDYVLNAWDEFYRGIKETVIGFPIWAEYFKDKDIEEGFPAWKKDFVRKNKSLYQSNKEFIDSWLKKYDNLVDFTPTQRKMEWQAGDKIGSLWDGVIQFRPSGIRVKTPTAFPALVAMVQIPIIGKYKRRLTVRETARLQSFPDIFIPDTDDHQAYKQFGNAVNVMVIEQAARKLFETE